MKRYWLTVFLCVVAVSMIVSFIAPAHSRPQYRKYFGTKYIKTDSEDEKEKAWAAVLTKADCNICHIGGKEERKNRNRFGKALAEILRPGDSKGNEKDAKKIEEAFAKVADTKVDPKDPKSLTYAELLKLHQFPGGDPEQKVEKAESK